MKIAGVAMVSVLATAVAANRGHFYWQPKAHASRKKAVGVATKTSIFMNVERQQTPIRTARSAPAGLKPSHHATMNSARRKVAGSGFSEL